MIYRYSSEELEDNSLPRFPDKGVYCEQCKTWIPQFEDLDELTESRLHKLIATSGEVIAMKVLQEKVGCNQRWAKIWVIHKGVPTPVRPKPPCPYCGGELRTSVARQCPHCLMQWHNG